MSSIQPHTGTWHALRFASERGLLMSVCPERAYVLGPIVAATGAAYAKIADDRPTELGSAAIADWYVRHGFDPSVGYPY